MNQIIIKCKDEIEAHKIASDLTELYSKKTGAHLNLSVV